MCWVEWSHDEQEMDSPWVSIFEKAEKSSDHKNLGII